MRVSPTCAYRAVRSSTMTDAPPRIRTRHEFDARPTGVRRGLGASHDPQRRGEESAYGRLRRFVVRQPRFQVLVVFGGETFEGQYELSGVGVHEASDARPPQ